VFRAAAELIEIDEGESVAEGGDQHEQAAMEFGVGVQ
jgi:hypothetical protein